MTKERQRYFRKIIHISAKDSPNVRYALAQKAAGLKVTNEILVPGLLSYEEYLERLNTWDEVRICIGLNGDFWNGSDVLMFPPNWLDRAERLYYYLRDRPRIARGMGVDPGEGIANSAVAVVDEFGLIELKSEKTKDTTRVVDMILETMLQYNLAPERVLLDRGGGGLQHVDRLRMLGYNVRSVGFGDKPSIEPQRHKVQFKQRVDISEKRYAYFNRRAEMYGELRNLLDPTNDTMGVHTQGIQTKSSSTDNHEEAYRELAEARGRIVGDIRGFTINPAYHRLREQLAPIPLKFENERLKMLPKHKKDANSKEKSLTELIGYSPDEADALVLAIHAMQQSSNRMTAGAV